DEDNAQWLDAAVKSRAFWKTAVQPETGLFPDYAEFDGTPTDYGSSDYHKDFRFDAWRTGMNIAMDYIWFGKDEWAVEQSNRWLDFFVDQGLDSYVNQYTLDGEPLSNDCSPGLVAMNAVTALAANHPRRAEFVQALWDLQVPSGRWRYYDGMLVMLALLQVSGNFQVYGPDPNS
ncbi:MAG: glycosyl hydrolase family 8, partial [Desulfobacterales bacterium]